MDLYVIINSSLNTYIYNSLFVEIKYIATVSTHQKLSPSSCSLWQCQRKEIRSHTSWGWPRAEAVKQ